MPVLRIIANMNNFKKVLRQLVLSAGKFKMMNYRANVLSLQLIPIKRFPSDSGSVVKRTRTIASNFHCFD